GASVSTLTALAAAAAAEGHLPVVSWLAELGGEGGGAGGSGAAASGSNKKKVGTKSGGGGKGKGAREKQPSAPPLRVLTPRVAAAAVQSGNMALLRWLADRGCGCGGGSKKKSGAAAGDAGSEEETEEEEDSEAEVEQELVSVLGCLEDAEGLSEELLELLGEQRYPVPGDGHAYLLAALNGDLTAIRCLSRLGCDWGPPGQVFQQAVADDLVPLPVLRALLEAGCVVLWEGA
ncbi:hypothetical protein Agub_g14233, partial [Astrephomene gubernaculifera]